MRVLGLFVVLLQKSLFQCEKQVAFVFSGKIYNCIGVHCTPSCTVNYTSTIGIWALNNISDTAYSSYCDDNDHDSYHS